MSVLKFARGLGLAIMGALFVPGMAVAGCWDGCCNNWSEFVRACSCEGGIAFKNPARCMPRQGPGDGIITPPTPIDPKIEQHRRYRVLIGRGLVDDAFFASLPISSDAEFLGALDRLQVALSRTAIVSGATRGLYDAKANAVRAKYRDYIEPRFALVDASDGLIPELRDGFLRAKNRHEEANRRLTRLRSVAERFIDGNEIPFKAERFRIDSALTAKLRVAAHLGRLTRAEIVAGGEIIREEGPQKEPFAIPVSAVPWYLGSPYLPHRAYQQAIDDAQSSLDTARMIALPSHGGGADLRLALAEKMAARAADKQAASRESFRYYQEIVAFTGRAEKQWASTEATNRRLWDQTQSYAHATVDVESTLKWTQAVYKYATSKAFKAAAVGAAWKVFRKTRLDPELKRISNELFAGRKFESSDDEIMAAWKLGTPLVAPTLTGYSRVKMLDGVVKMAKNLNGTAMTSMLTAADLLASAEPGDVKEYGDHLFGNLGVEARREAQSALSQSDLPEGFQRFWASYFTGAP